MRAEDLDKVFGLKINEIESALLKEARDLRPNGDLENLGSVLHAGSQTWVGLDPQILNTPYEELIRLCELLRPAPGTHFIDLGAGYGRLGLVLNRMCQQVRFTGFELVEQRVNEANRVFQERGLVDCKLFKQDLTAADFKIPKADFYFIYDFGKVAHIRQILKQLEVLADMINFKVIARGKGSRSIIEHEHPWLSQVFAVHKEENFSIYSMSF
jgi:16S rRNA G527 N7-methylase RsmG